VQAALENCILDAAANAFLRLGHAGRWRPEQALRQSEKLIRMALPCTSVGVWTEIRATGEWIASPIAKLLHGLPEQAEINYEVVSAAVHPEDRPRVEAFRRSMKDGKLEYRTLWPDGTVRWLLAKVRFIADPGGGNRLVGVIQDITDRKLIENALRKSEEKFAKAFQSNPAAISIVDLAGRFYVDINETFEALTGRRRPEVVGHTFDEVAFWRDPSRRDEAVAQLENEGRLRNIEVRFRGKNGGPCVGLLSADLLELDGRQCAIVTVVDITARVDLEGQLRQAQRLESVGRLAGGVAHDFNNLLTLINGYSEFILQALRPDDRLYSSAQEIKKAGERGAGLTRQLLAFGRKQVVELKPLDVNAIIVDAERMLRRLIGEDIELTADLDSRLGLVLADEHQIHQVIMNLVLNARDAMPDGGKIAIVTANADVGENGIAGSPDGAPGRYVLLTVTDTGVGMDEQTVQRAFEPFFTTKELGKGTGLGLSTVYGIVRQSGGWIRIRSEVGHGTSFDVYLPQTDAVAAPDRGVAAPAETGKGGGTVLVVEDQEDVRRLIRGILEAHGYRILEAANGPEALVLAGEHAAEGIHILLTDVVLPGINGMDLSEKLRTLRPGLKVLFMSGYTADVLLRHGVREQDVAYLAKPFSPDSLAAKVREVLTAPPTSPKAW